VYVSVADIIERVKKTELPPFRPTVPVYVDVRFSPEYYQLMEQCWLEHPNSRPDFPYILQTLQTFSVLRSVAVHRIISLNKQLSCCHLDPTFSAWTWH